MPGPEPLWVMPPIEYCGPHSPAFAQMASTVIADGNEAHLCFELLDEAARCSDSALRSAFLTMDSGHRARLLHAVASVMVEESQPPPLVVRPDLRGATDQPPAEPAEVPEPASDRGGQGRPKSRGLVMVWECRCFGHFLRGKKVGQVGPSHPE